MKKFILIITLLTFAMNVHPIIGESLAARMEKQQTLGWTITRVYDEYNFFAGATIHDESGQTVDQCNNELCVARSVQKRRLQLITDSNTAEGEQRALELEYRDTAEKIGQSEASTRELVTSIT